MGFDFILVAAICGFAIWFIHPKLNKWYWKTLIFIVILFMGLLLSAALGHYLDKENGFSKYLFNSPLFLIIGCSIGAWKTRHKKENKTKVNKKKVKIKLPKVHINLSTPIRRVGFIMSVAPLALFPILYWGTGMCGYHADLGGVEKVNFFKCVHVPSFPMMPINQPIHRAA